MFSDSASLSGTHFSHQHERGYALFDIGASCVSAAVVIRAADGSLRKVWDKQLEYAFSDAADFTRYERAMYATLLELGMTVTTEGVRVAQRDPNFSIRHLTVVVVFAPPWFLGSVRTEVRRKERPFTVTHGLMDELRSTMFSRFMDDGDSEAWREVMGTPEILETFEVECLLEGYRVVHCEGRSATEFMQRSYLAVVSQSVVAQVRDILHRVFANHHVAMTSSTNVLSRAADMHDASTSRSVLIELGGQITGISLLQEGVLRGLTVRPHGFHDALRAVAPKAKSATEARSAVELLRKKSGAEGGSMPPSLERVLAEWHAAVAEAVGVLTGGVTPPRCATLVTDPLWYDMYAPALGRAWQQPGIRHDRAFLVREVRTDPGIAADSVSGHIQRSRIDMLLGTACASAL